jgi:hypothetical protein
MGLKETISRAVAIISLPGYIKRHQITATQIDFARRSGKAESLMNRVIDLTTEGVLKNKPHAEIRQAFEELISTTPS